MAGYQVHIANPAKREIKKLVKSVQIQVAKTLDKLCGNPRPRGAEKLRSNPSCYRVRCGDYRIIYAVRVEMNAIIVLVVRDRKDAFKGLEELDGKLADALIRVADSVLQQSAVSGSA